MTYKEMTVATRKFLQKSNAVIVRLNLEEMVQKTIDSEIIQNMVEEEFERCLDTLKKAAIFAPEKVKGSAEKNAEAFVEQKERFISDFCSNFKIVLGMNPYVYLAENVKEDEVIKQFVMELFEASKLYDIVKKTLKYQTSGVMYKFFVASIVDDDLENVTPETMLALSFIDDNSDDMKLPSSITFC